MEILDALAKIGLSAQLTKDMLPYQREQLDKPQWEEAGRVHDWRNYVPTMVRNSWHFLSLETRLIVFVMADSRASDEEWD